MLIDTGVGGEPIWWQPSWATGDGISWPYISGVTFTSLQELWMPTRGIIHLLLWCSVSIQCQVWQ